MKAYCIQGSIDKLSSDGWKTIKQFPTFYLLANVQGIVSIESAKKVAYDILGEHCYLSVMEVDIT